MADFNELRELGMNKRITHQVETNLLGQRSNLFYDLAKKIQRHQFFRADDLGAEAALKVTDIADFNIHLLEFLLDTELLERGVSLQKPFPAALVQAFLRF